MAEDDLNFETLSAYVDGELPADEAARVAQLAASEPRTARRLAALQQLRAGVASVPPEMTELPQPPAPPRQRGRMAVLGAVAAGMLALALGLGWWTMTGTGQQRTGQTSFAAMLASHDALQEARNDAAPAPWPVSAGLSPARMSELMAATGLELVHSEIVTLPDGTRARHSGYLGSRGCRLSLFEIPRGGDAPDLPPTPFSQSDDVLQASWHTDAMRYVMIARDMNSVRFATIADSMRAAAQASARQGRELLATLENARQRCLV